jgi:hypothetical protein
LAESGSLRDGTEQALNEPEPLFEVIPLEMQEYAESVIEVWRRKLATL